MSIMIVSLYLFVIALFVFVVYLVLKSVEYSFCVFHGQIPFVPSAGRLRRAVVNEINSHYADMQTACDIGAGYGGLARCVSRKCGKRVWALESMPMTAAILWVLNLFSFGRVKTVWCDAFEYLKTSDGFDIGIAYLGPGVNWRLREYSEKFRVLITLDVPIDGLHPVRTIDVGRGFTRYGRKKFPHRLFVYEL